MPTIVLKPGLSWESLPVAEAMSVIDQAYLLAAVSQMRDEWTHAAGADLSSITLDLGLLLDDFETICKGQR